MVKRGVYEKQSVSIIALGGPEITTARVQPTNNNALPCLGPQIVATNHGWVHVKMSFKGEYT